MMKTGRVSLGKIKKGAKVKHLRRLVLGDTDDVYFEARHACYSILL